jgi:hypothetical protein
MSSSTSDLRDVRTLAVVGLAKNTGKTQTLCRLLADRHVEGRPVGVTSIGRDGERNDVLDGTIRKPAIRLTAGSLVATTGGLLRGSGVRHQVLDRTRWRTALGPVVIARLVEDGDVEVAGPSTVAAVGAVAETMHRHLTAAGRDGQVLIDGAFDRKAAAAPLAATGLVLATGAALDRDIDRVIDRTRDAVATFTLPEVTDPAARQAAGMGRSVLLAADGRCTTLAPRHVLGAAPAELATLLRALAGVTHVVVGGALCEPLVDQVRAVSRSMAIPSPTFVVADPTRVFLAARGIRGHAALGVRIEALRATRLLMVTANPVAPGAHRFDSTELLARLRAVLPPEIGVCDVLGDEAHRTSPERSPVIPAGRNERG